MQKYNLMRPIKSDSFLGSVFKIKSMVIFIKTLYFIGGKRTSGAFGSLETILGSRLYSVLFLFSCLYLPVSSFVVLTLNFFTMSHIYS